MENAELRRSRRVPKPRNLSVSFDSVFLPFLYSYRFVRYHFLQPESPREYDDSRKTPRKRQRAVGKSRVEKVVCFLLQAFFSETIFSLTGEGFCSERFANSHCAMRQTKEESNQEKRRNCHFSSGSYFNVNQRFFASCRHEIISTKQNLRIYQNLVLRKSGDW